MAAAHTKDEAIDGGCGGHAQRPSLVRISAPWADARSRTSIGGGWGSRPQSSSASRGEFGSDCDGQNPQRPDGRNSCGGFSSNIGDDSGGNSSEKPEHQGNVSWAGSGCGDIRELHLTPHWLAAAAARSGWPAAAAAAAVLMPDWQLAAASAPAAAVSTSSAAAEDSDEGETGFVLHSLESHPTAGKESLKSDTDCAWTNLKLQQREEALQQAEKRV
jgi:hypothetical protein